MTSGTRKKTVGELRKYLRDRGVSVQNYRKQELEEMCKTAAERKIPIEREYFCRESELKRRRFVYFIFACNFFSLKIGLG